MMTEKDRNHAPRINPIRPPGPDPSTAPMSTPISCAMRRATGDAFTRPLPPSAEARTGSRRGSGSGSARSAGSA